MVLQLLGGHPSVLSAPWVEGAERWLLGAWFAQMGGGAWDRAFDVHPRAHIEAKRPRALTFYAQQTKPIYLVDETPDIPASVRYPLDRIAAFFGARAGCALSSSIDHMLALACYEHALGIRTWDQIRLEGVWMTSVEEWVTQRECLAYWIGRAEGLGIDVVTAPQSALCAPEVIYGYDLPTGARRAPGTPEPVLA